MTSQQAPSEGHRVRRSRASVGAEPDARVRSRLRRFKTVSVLWSPFDDNELVFLLKGALATQGRLADRREIRIPVSLDARFHAGPRREVVVLSSLSYRGAFLEMPDPPPVDTQLRLEFELPTERFRLFARVLHRQEEDPVRPWWTSGVGVVFFGADGATELRLRKIVEDKGTRYLPGAIGVLAAETAATTPDASSVSIQSEVTARLVG